LFHDDIREKQNLAAIQRRCNFVAYRRWGERWRNCPTLNIFGGIECPTLNIFGGIE